MSPSGVVLDQVFPNCGTCTPSVTFAYLKGYIQDLHVQVHSKQIDSYFGETGRICSEKQDWNLGK